MFRTIYWLIAFVMVALYLVLLFLIEPQLALNAGGLPLLDLRPFGYTIVDVNDYFVAMDAAGWKIYLTLWYPIDMAFLVFLSAFFTLSIKVLFPTERVFWRIVSVALPLAYGVSDVAENLLVSAMFKVGPDNVQAGVIWLANIMTRAKFVFFAALVVLLVAGALRWLLARRRAA